MVNGIYKQVNFGSKIPKSYAGSNASIEKIASVKTRRIDLQGKSLKNAWHCQ